MTDERLEERPDVQLEGPDTQLVERLVALRGATTVEDDTPAARAASPTEAPRRPVPMMASRRGHSSVDVIGRLRASSAAAGLSMASGSLRKVVT